MTKEVLRKCVGCSCLKSKSELIKITCEHDSKKLFVNPNTKIFGRSAYLCYNEMCINESLKKNRLARVLKTAIPKDLQEMLQAFHKG